MTQIVKPDITKSASESIEKILGDFSFDEIIADIVSGKFSPQTDGLIKRLTALFFGELKTAFALIGGIAALVIISSVVYNLNRAFERKAISDAANFAIFVYIAAIAAVAFETAGKYVLGALRDISVFIHSIIPLMSTLCISGGEIAGATLSHPVIFFVCSAASTMIKNIITPLVLLRAVCILMSAITQNNGLEEFTELFSKLHKTLLSLSMSLFAGILGISSFAAASFDNLAARGVKFAVSASVPVVGGSIAEAMSSVAGSAMLLKNAVGLTGVIMLFAMFAMPLLKIAALSLAFRLTAAFTSPAAQGETTTILRKLGDCIDMLFSSVACMGTIMIIALASIL